MSKAQRKHVRDVEQNTSQEENIPISEELVDENGQSKQSDETGPADSERELPVPDDGEIEELHQASDGPTSVERDDEPAQAEAPKKPDARWKAMDTVPKVGIQVFISDTGLDDGQRVYWKRTRRMHQGRWQMTGKWVEALTGRELDIEPKFWHEV